MMRLALMNPTTMRETRRGQMTFEKGNSYKLDFDRVEQVKGKLFLL